MKAITLHCILGYRNESVKCEYSTYTTQFVILGIFSIFNILKNLKINKKRKLKWPSLLTSEWSFLFPATFNKETRSHSASYTHTLDIPARGREMVPKASRSRGWLQLISNNGIFMNKWSPKEESGGKNEAERPTGSICVYTHAHTSHTHTHTHFSHFLER